MTKNINKRFNDRRGLKEETLAEARPGSATDEAPIVGGISPDPAALAVFAIDGAVVIVGTAGNVTTLTPNAAALTSDRLLKTARDADRQRHSG